MIEMRAGSTSTLLTIDSPGIADTSPARRNSGRISQAIWSAPAQTSKPALAYPAAHARRPCAARKRVGSENCSSKCDWENPKERRIANAKRVAHHFRGRKLDHSVRTELAAFDMKPTFGDLLKQPAGLFACRGPSTSAPRPYVAKRRRRTRDSAYSCLGGQRSPWMTIEGRGTAAVEYQDSGNGALAREHFAGRRASQRIANTSGARKHMPVRFMTGE